MAKKDSGSSGMIATRLNVNPDALAKCCRHYGIVRLALFGAVRHGQEQPDSDVPRDLSPGFRDEVLRMAAMQDAPDAVVRSQREHG